MTHDLRCMLEAFAKPENDWHRGPAPRDLDLIGLGWNLDQGEVEKNPS